MTDNPPLPGPRRDMAMYNDWWESGWEHVLPRQGLPLTMLIGTACQSGLTGSLDDSALTFTWPDEEGDYGAAPEGREANEAAPWE